MFRKDKNILFKTVIGVIALIGVFASIYVVINNLAFVSATNDNYLIALEQEGNNQELPDGNLLLEELANLEPMPHIITNGPESLIVNQVILLDLVTGQPMEVHEFGEYDFVYQVWDFGNGFYGAVVAEEDSWSRSARFNTELPDDADFSERWNNIRFVIFDENLNPIDTLVHEWLSKVYQRQAFAVKLVEGQLHIYDFEFCDQYKIWSLQEFNIHTGENTILARVFELRNQMNPASFIGNNKMLMAEWVWLDYDSQHDIIYHILDLETGELKSLGVHDFQPGKLAFNGSNILINERYTFFNQVIMLDLENFSTESILLTGGIGLWVGDSIWINFSYDGNHIVSVNEGESVFRKYDLNGDIIAEADIIIPFPIGNDYFEIFPLTEQIYAIHTQTRFLEGGRHIQLVSLEGENYVLTPEDQLIRDVWGRLEWNRLKTPEDHHLSQADALEIGMQWIREEFGDLIDLTIGHHEISMEFNHEDQGDKKRAFWVGTLGFWDTYEYFYLRFVLDGITGERLGIADLGDYSSDITEVQWRDGYIRIFDRSKRDFLIAPSITSEHQPYHLAVESAALLMVELLENEFGTNLSNHEIELSLWTTEMIEGQPQAVWSANVTRPDENFLQGFHTVHRIVIDATTGEINEIEDLRDYIGPGINYRIENKEITINDMRLSIEIHQMVLFEPHHLTYEEIIRISADVIFEEFGVSLDGLYLGMRFWGDMWGITVTEPEEIDEDIHYMFQLFLDATTGNLNSIYDSRNVAY